MRRDPSRPSVATGASAARADHAVADPSAAFFRIKSATATYGVSRSFTYRALAEGKVVGVKAGRTLLVDGNSLRAYLASLPRAVFKGR